MADFQYTQGISAPGFSITGGKTYSASLAEQLADVASSNSTTQMNMALKVANVKAFAIVSDVNVTLKTNSSGSPANTLVLVAGIPYIWTIDSYDTFKLTTDVTALFFVNATGTDANIKVTAVVDATP